MPGSLLRALEFFEVKIGCWRMKFAIMNAMLSAFLSNMDAAVVVFTLVTSGRRACMNIFEDDQYVSLDCSRVVLMA